MTDKPLLVADGIFLQAFDLEGLNDFLKSRNAHASGLALMVMGTLGEGGNVALVAGEPIGERIASSANATLVRAVVVWMDSYFDPRHANYLCQRLMIAIASSRGLTAESHEAERRVTIDTTQVPSGDLEKLDGAFEAIERHLNDEMGYQVIAPRTVS